MSRFSRLLTVLAAGLVLAVAALAPASSAASGGAAAQSRSTLVFAFHPL